MKFTVNIEDEDVYKVVVSTTLALGSGPVDNKSVELINDLRAIHDGEEIRVKHHRFCTGGENDFI